MKPMVHHLTRRSMLGGLVAGGAACLVRRAPAQAAAMPVTIANASGSGSMTMQALMKQQGYLEEFGLEPNLMHIADGSKIVGGIVSGAIDASMMSGFAQLFPAIERGGKMKVLAGGALPPWLAVFTSKPEIRTLKDLEGRIVGIGSIGALLHQLMVALLKKHDVDVSKVQFVNIGGSVDVFKAVVVGTVDAGPAELSLIDQQAEFKVRLLEHGNLATELPEYTYQGAWTSDEEIQTKRDMLVRTLAAYAKLYRFVQSPDSQEAFLRARKTLFPKASKAEGVTQWNFIQTYKPYAENLVLDEERLNYMQRLNIDFKIQSRVLPFGEIADMSLAKDALSLLK